MTKAKDVSSQGVQVRVTPMALIRLIERRYGVRFVLDIAACPDNARAPYYFTEKENALTQDWKKAITGAAGALGVQENLAAGWLNPPFKRGSEFAAYCAKQAAVGARFVTLNLASLCSDWYLTHVEPNAETVRLRERVTFLGMEHGHTKELIVSFWGFHRTGLTAWSWQRDPLYNPMEPEMEYTRAA